MVPSGEVDPEAFKVKLEEEARTVCPCRDLQDDTSDHAKFNALEKEVANSNLAEDGSAVEITLDKSDGSSLGVTFAECDDELFIEAINGGLMQAWNDSNFDCRVGPGSRIVKVNNIQDVRTMSMELERHVVLHMEVNVAVAKEYLPPRHIDAAPDIRIGTCHPNLIEEYGVIHLQNALSMEGQQDLWQITKPHVTDPAGKATGFSNFCISSSKKKKMRRVSAFDEYGKLVFNLCADRLKHAMDAADVCDEPSYKHLHDLASGEKQVKLDECQGNYYREDAVLLNHVDCDGILFTMTVALGDDCEFAIGRPTGRPKRMSERNGKVRTIIMKSGDAMFFDGGSVPHEVKRMIPKTAPAWWEREKVPNGSRCVVLFREKEENYYDALIKASKPSQVRGHVGRDQDL
eukprot:TRINITY_DN75112_c0_g1_i1.p1 TRINITY_DN75112_c0_g1~~TRINITY_DN75112_c0_g1_i1.p1  ORF type:complete len:433 (+),score=67.10 TRINITY_DN75112_c0_g1_i1:91-1299(+)